MIRKDANQVYYINPALDSSHRSSHTDHRPCNFIDKSLELPKEQGDTTGETVVKGSFQKNPN
jgi:hypothetical protein